MIPVEDVRYNDSGPFATYALITINIFLFLVMLPMAVRPSRLVAFYSEWGVSRSNLSPATLLTHMFLHANWLHVASNMFFLGFFGRNVERRLTSFGFVPLYMGCGFLAGLAQVASSGTGMPLVGASGAVYAVMGAYVALFARRKIRAFYIFLPHPAFAGTFTVPAWVYVLLFAVLQDAVMLAFPGMSAVGHVAHLAGFGSGLGAGWLMSRLIHVEEKPPPARRKPHTTSVLRAMPSPEPVGVAERVQAAGTDRDWWVVLTRGEMPRDLAERLSTELGRPVRRRFFALENVPESLADAVVGRLTAAGVAATTLSATYVPAAVPVTLARSLSIGPSPMVTDASGETFPLERGRLSFFATGRVEFHHHAHSGATDRVVPSVVLEVVLRKPLRAVRFVRHVAATDERVAALCRVLLRWAPDGAGAHKLRSILDGEPPPLFRDFSEYDRYIRWLVVMRGLGG